MWSASSVDVLVILRLAWFTRQSCVLWWQFLINCIDSLGQHLFGHYIANTVLTCCKNPTNTIFSNSSCLQLVLQHIFGVLCVFPGSLLSLGDVLAQFCVEKRSLETYDKKRTLRFAIFGTFFGVSSNVATSAPMLMCSVTCSVDMEYKPCL